MIEFIINLLWIVFGFWIGIKIAALVKPHKTTDNTTLNKETIIQDQIKKIPMLKTEIHDGIIFLFNSDDESFISQGNTIDDVAESAYKFRKIDLAYVIHSGYPMWFLNGKVTIMDVKII
jgi:hypothetical protein